MNKFNGKMLEAADTNSEMTTQTKRTTKSSQGEKKTPKGTRYGSPGADELDEAATLMPGQTLNERDPNFDGEFDMRGGMDEDEAMEEERMGQMRKAKESPRVIYKDGEGQVFNPSKKFGIIEDNSLIYDNVTTSYPLNLPTDFYQKYINQNMPNKEGGNGKWFIRPHHLETLTQHPLSIKDDVLNTRYYSHYNQSFGKKEEKNDNADAIVNIEKHLEHLK